MKYVIGAAIAASALLAQPASASAQEKVLRIAHYGFNPQKGQFHMAFGQQATLPLMSFAESLTYLEPSGKVVPGLATAWSVKDPTTWVVKIRPDVKFQNGRPMTADQIVRNVEFLVSDDVGKASISASFLQFTGAKKIDEQTVEISTKAPNPILDRWFSMFRIMDADYFKEVGNDGFATAPIGTGSFRVTSWANERMEAVRFAGAWRPAKVDRIIINSLTETPTRVQALVSGQADIAWQVNSDSIAQIRGAGREVALTPIDEIMSIKFNVIPERTTVDNKAILDPRVRQAINYGINREDFIKNVLGGITVPASQSGTRTTLGYQEDLKPFPYDPERARKLLNEAGHAGGVKLVAELIPTSTDFTDTMQYVAQDLKKIGIDLEVRQIALADLLAKLRGQKKWDGHMWAGLVEPFPTNDMMRPFATDSCTYFGAFICDPTIQPAIDAANVEFDAPKRAALVRQVVKHYHDQALITYMFERVQIDGLSKSVRNYRLFNRAMNWHEIDLAAN